MAAALITITNISKQVVPILIDAIATNSANSSSDITPSTASQLAISPGAQLVIESQRIDLAQLDQLRTKRLISFQQ